MSYENHQTTKKNAIQSRAYWGPESSYTTALGWALWRALRERWLHTEFKDPTPHRLGAWWKDGARSVDSVYRDKHWHIGTPTHCAIRDFHRGTRKEKVPAKWAAKSVRLTAQLRTGVCGSLGGISEEGIECYWCKTPDHDGKHELRRGGSAVNHLFRCPHPTVVSKRDELLVPLLRREESVVTAAFLWEHPGAALRYAEFFFSGRAATPDDDADVENNTQVNEPLL